MAPGSLTYRPWFVGVSVEIEFVSFEWNSFREGFEDVRSDCWIECAVFGHGCGVSVEIAFCFF